MPPRLYPCQSGSWICLLEELSSTTKAAEALFPSFELVATALQPYPTHCNKAGSRVRLLKAGITNFDKEPHQMDSAHKLRLTSETAPPGLWLLAPSLHESTAWTAEWRCLPRALGPGPSRAARHSSPVGMHSFFLSSQVWSFNLH